MPKTATVQARVDAKTKAEAQRILGELDITLTQAIVVYLRQIIFNNGIPFVLKIPNELTAETLDKSEAREDLHSTSSVDELFKELDA
jgi:DNA-damage-inducible protein J